MKIKPFKLERYFADYEFKSPYLLCSSDCETFSVAELFSLEAGAESGFKEFRLGYTESQGSPELREAVSGLYTDTLPEDIIVCAGAEEAVFIFMNTVLEPGDHIIVLSPAYQALFQVAEAIGCRVTEWHMDPAQNWAADPDFPARHITPQTKAIVVNFPNNPTGFHPTKETYAGIVDLCRRHGLYLFSDEVYRYLEYKESDRLPAGCDVYERGVSLGVMSKAFGLAGLRIGWIACRDKEMMERFAAFKDYTTICSSGPSEFLAVLALRHKNFLLERNRSIIADNLVLLRDFFTRHADYFHWTEPKAGPLIFPELKRGFKHNMNAETFCRDLLEKSGVLLLPGNTFNCPSGADRLRFGFGRKNMPQALERLDGYITTAQ